MLHEKLYLCFIAVILTVHLKTSQCEDGDMGHFQVHNAKEGSLKIHATKEIAQIETQANSVQVLLEPGKVNTQSEENRDGEGKKRKLIHIVNADYRGGLRRSRISMKKNKEIKYDKERTRRALMEGEKTFENSILLEKWKNENWPLIKSNLHRKHNKQRRSVNMRKYKKETMKTKKSEIEKATRVHGRTGGLHVTTGKHGTKLISKGGALNVFIKNEEGKEDDRYVKEENSDRRSTEDHTNYHVINANMNGLSLKRSVEREGSESLGCAIPPCVP